ncbi:MAG TPA: hypothetical protein VIL85_24425 [Thermomicrobiales bacterium]
MSESKRPLALCGENPALTLYRPGTVEAVAVAGYWRCVYSPHGEGEAILVWVDPVGSGLGDAAPHAIYSDNLPMARYIVATFNQHFPEYQGLGFGALEPLPARFFQESHGGSYHRAACHAGPRTIELTWREILDRKLLSVPDFPCGERRFDLSTVLCPCGSATLVVDGRAIEGEVRAQRDGDSPQSSAFLAFCETWVGPLD